MQNLPYIHLLGNPEENFYALGKRDAQNFGPIVEHMTKLVAQNEILGKVFQASLELSNIKIQRIQKSNHLDKELEAYAEGLERPIKDVYFALLLPEVVAAFNKWTPNLMGIIPGCSSLFMWDELNQGAVHARILDYALASNFENSERSILYEFTNRYKVYSYSTAGMPFPALTSMNEKGLTLALHYKHGDYFDLKGHSIFAILYQVMSYCSDIHEVKKYLKNYPSIGYWGLYMSDRNGHVASIDICGSQIYQEKFDLKEHPYLYFNNRPLIKDQKHNEIQPFGNLSQCKMRNEHITKSMQVFKQGQNLDQKLLTLLTQPKVKEESSARDWKLGPITPTSIQVTSFHNGLNQSLFVTGEAPKLGVSKMVKVNNLFDKNGPKDSILNIQTKNALSEQYIKGHQYLSRAQASYDQGKEQRAYHELQMAMKYHQNYPDFFVEKFFFTVWQYLNDSSTKDFVYLYDDFYELQNKLPEYLEDHRQLFLMRLGKILGHKIEFDSSCIQHEQLKRYYDKESKMNSMAIKMLRKLTFPRIDILDVIYTY